MSATIITPNLAFLRENCTKKRIIVLQGGTRCVIPSTIVHTVTGYKPISEIEVGEYVFSLNEETNKIEAKQVVNKFLYNCVHKSIKTIIFDFTNYKIECTYDHKFRINQTWIRAIDIANGVLEARAKHKSKVLGKQLRTYSDRQLQKQWASHYNEIGNEQARVFRNNDSYKREILFYKGSQGYSRNIFTKSRKETGSQSQERNQGRQFSNESGMGYTSGKLRTRYAERVCSKHQWRKKWNGNFNGRFGKKNKSGLQAVDFYHANDSGQIRDKEVYGQRCFDWKDLEIGKIKNISFSQTDCVIDIEVKDNHNYFINYDNTLTHNSSKTYSVLQFIIETCYFYQGAGIQIDITRKTVPALRDTVIKDFFSILKDQGIYNQKFLTKSEKTYQLFGNTISWYSLDDEQKVRGRKRHMLYINEANEIDYELFRQLAVRGSGKIIMDYNPSFPDGWIYDHVLTRPDACVLQTTYKDNPFLSAAQIREIEMQRETDPDWFHVFGLGHRAQSKVGQVYTNWNYCDYIPKGQTVYALDWGFTNSKCALVRLTFVGEYDVYLESLIYETGLSNEGLIIRLRGMGLAGTTIIADNNEPKSIAELRAKGFNIIGVKKPDVMQRIKVMQGKSLYIQKNEMILKQEFSSYLWKLDKNMKPTNEPDKQRFDPHALDAAGYGIWHMHQHQRANASASPTPKASYPKPV